MTVRAPAVLVVILAALAVPWAAASLNAQSFDVVIRNGRVLDGSGNPWFFADVGIRGDEIAAIGDLSGAVAERVVDAAGQYVTPGFIALHEHIEPDILDGYGTLPNYTTQGFTTAVINTDGYNFGAEQPLWPLQRERDLLEDAGSALNLALLVPHGIIRNMVMGTAPDQVMRYATPAEIDEMRALVREGMEAGAFGLSTGLEYNPMRYSSEEEVRELAREAALYGGHFQAHMRSQGRYPKWQLPSHMDHPTQRHVTWMDAIMEILTIGRETGIPVMIDHIHPKGPREWGMSRVTTQLIDEMWEDGHPVYLNMHSYEGYSAYVTLMPRWALIDGEVPGQSMADDFPPVEYGDMRANLRARLADPVTREMIRRDAEYEMLRQGGADNLLITDFPDESLVGKTLAQLAAERGETPFETAIWLQMNGFDRPGGVLWMAQAVGTEDIIEWMVRDYTAVTLDRGGDRPDIRGNPAVHPGQYGTSGRLIREHVMTRGTITLPHAIRSLTGLAALILRLPDRGALAVGMRADVVVFDPETIRTDATYLNPFVFQEGMTHVLVNGVFVVDEGAPTDALPGEVLRRPGPRPAAAASAPSGGPKPGDAALAELDLTLENIHRTSGGVRGVAISPDGLRLAISGSGPGGAGLYLAERGDGGGFEAPRLWLEGSSPAWAPDGGRLAFARGGEIRIAEVGDADARPVTDDMGGVRAPAFSPDGRTIAFYSTKSGHQDIWLVSADGSTAPRQLTDAAMALDDPRFAPAWSPNGREIAYVSNASDYWHDDLWVVDVRTGARRQVTRTLMAMSSPVWSPEGDRIAVFGTARDEYWYEDLAYIYVIEKLDGSGTGGARPSERIVDMQVYATDAAMRHAPSWSEDGRFLYFPYLERGTVNVWVVPAGGGVATRITHMGGTISALSHAAAAGSLAFVHSTPTRGGEAYTLDLGGDLGGMPRRVTSFAPAWRSVAPPLEVSFESFDGLRIQGFLYRPPDLGGEASCPALVQVHGGGTNSYQRGLNLTEQYLASKGFVVLAINYRGGSGFGREFQDLAVEDWLWDQARDAGAAADFLRTLPYANGKVGIYGGSYGGSMSLSAISLAPDKFDAAVPMRGAYSKLNTLEYTDRLGKIFSVTGHGGTPEERPDSYAKSDVVSRIADITAPVLLMHGELDRRVPIQNFENAVAEFERLGKSVEVKTYPEEGHGFRNPGNRIDTYARLEAFFARHLGGCATD